MNQIEAEKTMKSVSISKSHSYTKEKVLMAEAFLAKNTGRNINGEELIKTYNAVKGSNVQMSACKSCGINKYLTGLQNYAKYGRMVLANEGINIDEPTPVVPTPTEIAPERVQTGIEETKEEVIELVGEKIGNAKRKTTKKK